MDWISFAIGAAAGFGFALAVFFFTAINLFGAAPKPSVKQTLARKDQP